MTKNETIKILAILDAAYPNYFKDMNKQQKTAQIELYHSRFMNYPAQIVVAALERYIDTNKYPPTIAGLKDIINRYKDENDVDVLWNEAWAAICGSIKFKDLKLANKKYFGNQSAIDDLGLSEDTIQSVVKGQYLKRINEILETEKAQTQVIKSIGEENFKQLIGKTVSNLMLGA